MIDYTNITNTLENQNLTISLYYNTILNGVDKYSPNNVKHMTIRMCSIASPIDVLSYLIIIYLKSC